MVSKSRMKFENIDMKEMLKLLNVNEDKIDVGFLKNFLPRRKHNRRRMPTMKNAQMMGPHNEYSIPEEERLWEFPPLPETEELNRKLVGKVMELSIQIIFKNYVYTFNGKL